MFSCLLRARYGSSYRFDSYSSIKITINLQSVYVDVSMLEGINWLEEKQN